MMYMPSFNQVILIGHLGKDPEIKTFNSGNKIAKFPLATNSPKKDGDGNWIQVASWHNVQINLERSVNFTEKFVKKGDLVQIVGTLTTDTYEKNGENVYFTKVVVQNASHLISKINSTGTETKPIDTTYASKYPVAENIDDEIPF